MRVLQYVYKEHFCHFEHVCSVTMHSQMSVTEPPHFWSLKKLYFILREKVCLYKNIRWYMNIYCHFVYCLPCDWTSCCCQIDCFFTQTDNPAKSNNFLTYIYFFTYDFRSSRHALGHVMWQGEERREAREVGREKREERREKGERLGVTKLLESPSRFKS